MVRCNLLGTERGDNREVGVGRTVREQLGKQPDREGVGPLAVVEHDQHWAVGRGHGGQQSAQADQAANLTELLRPGVEFGGCVKEGAERR